MESLLCSPSGPLWGMKADKRGLGREWFKWREKLQNKNKKETEKKKEKIHS